jgi:hypothetical protein
VGAVGYDGIKDTELLREALAPVVAKRLGG